MAIRTGMTDIVKVVRTYGQAATDDSFDGVTYWSDEQLQTIADRNGTRGSVRIESVSVDNTIYKIVAPRSVMVEDGGLVYNVHGTQVTVPYTLNPDTQELTFDEALLDSRYNLNCFTVQVYDALAELWQVKADQRFNYVDWKAQNNKLSLSQEYQHCIDRAIFYRSKRVRSFDRKGRGKWYI